MYSLGRRSFLTLAAGSAVSGFARTLPVVGVQLYTVRSILPQKPLETLRALEQIGYREAEVVAAGMEAIWPSLKQTALKPVSLHLATDLFMTQQEKLPAALDDAKTRGFEYVVCPYIAPKDRGGVDVIRRLGETLNKAGEICRKSGLGLCYHNHAFEFEPSGSGTLLDVLMQTADAKLVSLELDIMWSQVAGVDPVKVLERYGSRVALMHLKNVAEATEKRYNESVPRTAFKEVGKGVIDIPSVLRAGAKAGVKHYFVEQDQTPGDPVESLRESYQYLSKLNF
jgi:sugar phosphate isomerase/epimerase